MTTTTPVPVALNANVTSGRSTVARMAGIAGLIAVVFGVGMSIIDGTQPNVGASVASITAFFDDGHQFTVVVSALLAIPIAVFMVGVHRTLADADRVHGTSWATLFLYGAVMMSATAGLAEALFATAAFRRGLAPEMLRVLNDASQIARATLGAWIAVTVGTVAVASWQHRIRPRWYAAFCTIGAALGAVAVVDTVSATTSGTFAQLAFGIGVIVWLIVTSVLMLGDARGRQAR